MRYIRHIKNFPRMKRSRSFSALFGKPGRSTENTNLPSQIDSNVEFYICRIQFSRFDKCKIRFLSLRLWLPCTCTIFFRRIWPGSTFSSHLIPSPASLKQISDICLFMWRGVLSLLKSSIVSKRSVQSTILDKINEKLQPPLPPMSVMV